MSLFSKLFGGEKKEEPESNALEEAQSLTLDLHLDISPEKIASILEENRAKAEADYVEYLYEWRTSEKHGGRRKKPCRDCKSRDGRDGQIHGLEYWNAVGIPRSGATMCGKECTCELVKVGEFRYKEKEHVWYEPGYATEEDMNSERKKSITKHYDQEGQVFWKEGQ